MLELLFSNQTNEKLGRSTSESTAFPHCAFAKCCFFHFQSTSHATKNDIKMLLKLESGLISRSLEVGSLNQGHGLCRLDFVWVLNDVLNGEEKRNGRSRIVPFANG